MNLSQQQLSAPAQQPAPPSGRKVSAEATAGDILHADRHGVWTPALTVQVSVQADDEAKHLTVLCLRQSRKAVSISKMIEDYETVLNQPEVLKKNCKSLLLAVLKAHMTEQQIRDNEVEISVCVLFVAAEMCKAMKQDCPMWLLEGMHGILNKNDVN